MPVPSAPSLRHRALPYSSLDELVETAVPIMHDGVRAGDAVLVVSSDRVRQALHEALPPADARAVSFGASSERYARPGRALTTFQRAMAGYAEARQPVRMIAEQPLAALPEGQVAELGRVDAAFNEVSQARDATVVCTYDLRVTPAPAVEMLRRSHPELIEDGRCHRSPQYTDAATLLARQQAGQELPEPAGDVALLPCPRDATEAREFVAGAAALHGLAGGTLEGFVTAVNEVVTNAVEHAVLDCVRVWSESGRVVCEVRDYGFGLADPLAGYRHPEPSWVSGRGLWLARQLADLVEVRSGLGGCTFRLHAGPPSATPA